MKKEMKKMSCLFAAPDMKPDLRKLFFGDTQWISGFDGIKEKTHDLLVVSLGQHKDTKQNMEFVAIVPKARTAHITGAAVIERGFVFEAFERGVIFHHAKNERFPGTTWIEFLSNEPLEEDMRRGHIDVKNLDAVKEMLILYLATGTIEKIQLDSEYGPNNEPPVFNDPPPFPRPAPKGKVYTSEELQQIVRTKLTALGGSEENIQKWIENLEGSPDRNMMTHRLESGLSEFERKVDGSFSIVVEMGFGGPMFDGMPDALKKALGM